MDTALPMDTATISSTPAPCRSVRRRRLPPALFTYHTDVGMVDGTVIRTTVTSEACAVTLFLQEFPDRRDLIVGLDTEWRQITEPDGRRRGYQVAVLQLCVGHRCLVFQLFHADEIPAELACFLADPAGISFVGVGVDGDVKRLLDDCNLVVANAVDLREVAALELSQPNLFRAGLKTLTFEVMGVRIDKPKHVTMSNWAAQPLTPQQVAYACIDAFVSFETGRRLITEKCRWSLPPTGWDVEE